MAYAYFPGCTLHQQESELDRAARRVCEKLGLDMVELDTWQCCGAVYPLAEDALFPLLSPYRALVSAQAAGRELVTLCSGCFNVLRRTAFRVNSDAEVKEKLARFTELEPTGPLGVKHLLEVLLDREDAVKEAVSSGLDGMRVACYYGCLLVRPAAEMEFDDCERPRSMDRVMLAAGAEPVRFSHATECCGAYVSVAPDGTREAAARTAQRVVSAAAAAGAELLLTSCPLCKYNLGLGAELLRSEGKPTIPVTYFLAPLANALGVGTEPCGVSGG